MAKLVPVPAFDLLIFGGTGDLAMRKLLPALYHRDGDGQISEDSRIIALGRSELSRDAYLVQVKAALEKNLKAGEFDHDRWQSFSQRLYYLHNEISDAKTWQPLVSLVSDHKERVRVAYLALPSTLYGNVADSLKQHHLITGQTRIVLEKPVGHDTESARKINDHVGACFSENQIYRIDHYLGKETVQNLLALRFANSLFEPLWRRGAIDHVQITVAENLGVGGRAEFYDQTGALRDMVQNHLLQLLCLVAMEPPISLSHDSIRDEKLKVLRALKPIDKHNVNENTVRGQYRGGTIDGIAVPSFNEDMGSDHSRAESFVALKLEIENWRWANVPFYLRTGKRLPAKHSEIVIQFQSVPHSIFPEQEFVTKANRLSIRLQPDEGVKLNVMAKEPGPGGFDLRSVSLDLSFEEAFDLRYPDAYERLLMEVMRGNPALFMRGDEVEAAWLWIDSLIEAWQATQQKIESYPAGTWGPSAAALLLDRSGRQWHGEG